MKTATAPSLVLESHNPADALAFARLVAGGAYWSGHFTKNADGQEAYKRLTSDAIKAVTVGEPDAATIAHLRSLLRRAQCYIKEVGTGFPFKPDMTNKETVLASEITAALQP